MYKLLGILFFIQVLFSSCGGAKQEVVDKMANEMCSAIAMYDESDPMSIMQTSEALEKIIEKSDEYKKVRESQFIEALETICPDAYSKYLSIVSSE